MKRVGFVDKVKQEGPLPRLKDDSKAIVQKGPYKATNNWAEHRALHGQNDYIDILGELTTSSSLSPIFYILCLGNDEIHPKNIMYHVPKYLRGIHKKDKYFQMMIKRRDFYAKTPFPKQYPSKWQGWNLLVSQPITYRLRFIWWKFSIAAPSRVPMAQQAHRPELVGQLQRSERRTSEKPI